ncbi:MAG: undecaprenyl-phosphate galactose phosphotransferase WbaP, partial [Planctomycetota bacterium]
MISRSPAEELTVDSATLPIGVISTDTLERLDPFVPSSAVREQRLSRRGRSASSVRVYSTPTQVVLTASPLVGADALMLAAAIAVPAWMMVALLPMLGITSIAITLSSLMTTLFLVASTYGVIACLIGLFPAAGISPVMELRQTVLATASAFVLATVIQWAMQSGNGSEMLLSVVSCGVACLLVPLGRMMARHSLSGCMWWGERAVIIGSGPQGRALFRFHQRAASRGLRPIGIIDCEAAAGFVPSDDEGEVIPYLGSVRRLSRLSRRHRIRWGIVAPGGCGQIEMNEVLAHAGNLPNVLILPSQVLLPSLWASTRECAGVMGVHVRDHLHNPLGRLLKRLIDVAVSASALFILSPVMLVIVALIKWWSPGAAFYGHKRIGKGGKSFHVWKFRSMVTNADQVLKEHLDRDPVLQEEWLQDQKLRCDPRIIPRIGHFLRKSSLDELPQLWNVLVGEMSLVGPRPIVAGEVERYREMYPLYLRVTPGITGLWQISGRNDTSYDQRVRLDSYYVNNWSPWLDTYI